MPNNVMRLIFCLLVSSLFLQAGNDGSLPRKVFPAMGTVAGFSCQASGAAFEELFCEVGDCFENITKLANLYDKQSELSRLNQIAQEREFICSPELYNLLLEARKAYHATDGAFDITAKPLMDLWGFYRKKRKSMPDREEITAVLQKVGLEKVRFDDRRRSVFFTVKGMQLDLGGIAKGYAVDMAFARVKDRVQSCIIDLGGNLFICNPAGKSSRIGIRHPLYEERLERVISVGKGAVSTSGGYERFVVYNNQKYAHIIDPGTGFPAERCLAVTVKTTYAAQADWMSTGVFLRGKKLAEKLVKSYPGSEIFIYKSSPDVPGYIVEHIK